MKKILITLALLMSFTGSVSAALTTTYVTVPNLGAAPNDTKTVNVAVLKGDVVVMSAATNKKPSVAAVVFSSTGGTFAEFTAVDVEGSGLDVTNSFMAYLTIAADGSYDFTATGSSSVTANVALYVLSASSGEVRQLDTKAGVWEKVVDGDPIGGINKLRWNANIDYGEIAIIGAGSSTKGDLSTTHLDLDMTDNNGVKRLLGHKAPVNKGTIAYDVTWKGTSKSGTAKDHGSTISMAFVEFGTAVVPTYSIGGTLSGMSGNITLQNNGGDNLVRNANGSFTFATELLDTATYAVTVSTQPATQTCTVTNGNGAVAAADVTNVTVTCTDVPTYSIGGTLSGLVGSVTLQNNNGDDLALSADGSFTFATELPDTATYAVTVSTQPATQTCTVTNGNGAVAAADVTNVAVDCVTVTKFNVGGTLSGLSGGVTLQNNGADDLALNADGSFTFATALTTGDAYLVTVSAQPATQTCTVTNESGTIASADITNVVVTCVNTPTHSVGGTVSGLTGGVTLQNNGADDLVVTADGSFTFGTPVKEGDTYAVTVSAQPTDQTCTVTNGSGTVSAAVIDIVVNCVNSTPPPVTGPVTPIPTLSEWALMLLSMLLGLIVFKNRRRLFA